MTLRVATFNLKSTGFQFGHHSWKKRRALLRDTIRELNADIIGVQELTPIMKTYLENELSDYNFIGHGRGGLVFNEHSDIAVKNGIDINCNSTFPLSKNKSGRFLSVRSPLSWIFPRICTFAELCFEGQKFRIFNTHLDVSSDTARMFQLKMIFRKMTALNASTPLPTILTGDFNAKPDSKTISFLKTSEFPKLSSVSHSENECTYHFFCGRESHMRIDHIFASPEFSSVSEEIFKYSDNGLYPSDHYPLIATLTL